VKKTKKKNEDRMLKTKKDRRLLANVPDGSKKRSNLDRRGQQFVDEEDGSITDFINSQKSGLRYIVEYDVEIIIFKGKLREKHRAVGIDISTTGILLKIDDDVLLEKIKAANQCTLKFEILPGTMPEGYEMDVDIKAHLVRTQKEMRGDLIAFEFDETLAQYSNRTKDRYMLVFSSLLLFLITAFIILMRTESVLYFKFNKYLYLYSIIAASFLLSRYFFGALYKPVQIDKTYTPGVSIVIPCFNEEEWIQQTILSCMNQDYPVEKLEVIVVDDVSNDQSVHKIKDIVEKLREEAEIFDVGNRLQYIVQVNNMGKRGALARGTLIAKHDLMVFVDSDSFLDPFAIRNLVQPFKDSKIGGVSGRTDVANGYTNALTKMQAVRYFIAFRVMKAAEAHFDAVTCLSGPLACYRRSIVMENMSAWLNQSFLGQRATFGDDRSMTNFVLKKHRTGYQDTAICATVVPNDYNVFLKQQMRWKRSWLRESIVASKFMWKKEPFMAATFYMGVIVPVAAPAVVIYNLLFVPITQNIFPTTFLVGIFMMALLMSIAQMFLRKSSTWVYGFLFVVFYEAVLLWQMPIAWVTFWKSTWGTRMTPEDIKEEQRKDRFRKTNLKK